ncbi:RhoGAP domain protein [Dictyocaulus viviparus]|uniref:RhoGAP domain protein n=1 Tax=Dictyocaulus viviparus TaxID=29172 RepID=A0A0D8XJ43_DICVI|nr:RhoGAP domain protein [Dictyocaulus viviparus]
MIEDFKDRKRKGLRLWKCASIFQQSGQIFGVPIQTAIDMDPSMDGIPLPAFFRHAVNYVESHGIMQEGIYRLSCPKSRIDEIERNVNEGKPLCFSEGHEAAELIKSDVYVLARFLRQLPQPLLSGDFEMLVENCSCKWRNVCQCVVFPEMKKMLRRVSRPQFYLLGYMIMHIQNVINMPIHFKESINKMGIHALELLFQTIMNMSRHLICYLIVNGGGTLSKERKGDSLFGDLRIMP